jgi:hypothetical protein
LGTVESAIVAKPLGMKSHVIRTTLKPMHVPLLGQAKQEGGVILVSGRTRTNVGLGLLVSWKMGRTIVALSNHHPHSLVFLH